MDMVITIMDKQKIKLIDIHTHILYSVDDGSSSLETSINLIKEEISQGVTDIILTPHYRTSMFEKSPSLLVSRYQSLKEEVKKLNLDVNLYLGQEIYIRNIDSFNKYLDEGKILTINKTNYVLLEFSYTNDIDILEVVYNVKLLGYNVIIAHIERYNYVTQDLVEELIENGALIQVNAESVIGKCGSKIKKIVKSYLKRKYISFIASDIHSNRVNYINKCYKYVTKKYGIDQANDLFYNNARKLLND